MPMLMLVACQGLCPPWSFIPLRQPRWGVVCARMPWAAPCPPAAHRDRGGYPLCARHFAADRLTAQEQLRHNEAQIQVKQFAGWLLLLSWLHCWPAAAAAAPAFCA